MYAETEKHGDVGVVDAIESGIFRPQGDNMNKKQQERIKLLACAIMGFVSTALAIQWYFNQPVPL